MANTRSLKGLIKAKPTQRVSTSSLRPGRGNTSINLRRANPAGPSSWNSGIPRGG